MPAAGYRFAGDNPLRFTLAGCLENRHVGVDLAQARARRNQQAVGQQLPQPGDWASKAARSAPLMVAMKSSRGGASLRRRQVHGDAQNRRSNNRLRG